MTSEKTLLNKLIENTLEGVDLPQKEEALKEVVKKSLQNLALYVGIPEEEIENYRKNFQDVAVHSAFLNNVAKKAGETVLNYDISKVLPDAVKLFITDAIDKAIQDKIDPVVGIEIGTDICLNTCKFVEGAICAVTSEVLVNAISKCVCKFFSELKE